MANLQADFFNQIKQSVSAEAEKQGIKVQVADAGGDSATQVNQIQDFITRKVDAIIYIPAGATAAGVPVKAAEAAGDPRGQRRPQRTRCPRQDVHCQRQRRGRQDPRRVRDQADQQQGQLAILQGQIGTTPQVDREKGFRTALQTTPDVKVIAEAPAEWAQDKAYAKAQDMIQAHPDINVFWGQADAMALGAAQAVATANLSPKAPHRRLRRRQGRPRGSPRRKDRRDHGPADPAHGSDGR